MKNAYYARATCIALLIALAACTRTADTDVAGFQNYVDRQAIETTLVRYSTGLDTLNAELYASAFTEDAEFSMEGKVYRGREEIGAIITGMKAGYAERAADADATNDPPRIMHHVMSNAVIDIVAADRALHHCYWMTVNGGPAMYSFRVAAEGRYEDELVKRDGKWLIHRRKIVE